jgi:hypothetical protein
MDGMLSSRVFLSPCAGLVVNLKQDQWAGETKHFGEQTELLPVHATWTQKSLTWKRLLGVREGGEGCLAQEQCGDPVKPMRPPWGRKNLCVPPQELLVLQPSFLSSVQQMFIAGTPCTMPCARHQGLMLITTGPILLPLSHANFMPLEDRRS